MKPIFVKFLIIMSAALYTVSGCSTHSPINKTAPHKPTIIDGAPSSVVDVSLIEEPIAKSEPLSRYGNHSPYTVLGKTYQVWPIDSPHQAEGIASWYGTKFHGQRTSSWEPYDMLTLTAAHKHLPLPSYVRVTNMENQKSVVVKVNDRGPFHDDRIIDLSYAAALKLGFAEKGTARVQIETIALPYAALSEQVSNHLPSNETKIAHNKKPSVPTPAKNPIPNDQLANTIDAIYLQAGAFSDETAATRLKNELGAITDIPINIIRGKSNHPKMAGAALFKVQIGPLYDPERAQLLNQLIRDTQIAEPIIIINALTAAATN